MDGRGTAAPELGLCYRKASIRNAPCDKWRSVVKKEIPAMNRNTITLIAGVLAVVAVILAFQLYQERQKAGIEINVGESGISIQEK